MRYPLLLFITFLCLFRTSVATAQEDTTAPSSVSISQMEDSLVTLADSMMKAMVPETRLDYGIRFARKLHKALLQPESFTFPFEKLGKKIHILYPKDKSFRIFNWLIAPGDNIRRYYGIIQNSDHLYPLMNYSEKLHDDLLTSTLDAKHWYGAEYYKILDRKVNGQNYYFLFGLNTDGNYSNKKILDVLFFDEQGPVFGAPMLVVPAANGQRLQTQNRALWEYKKDASFSLNFDESRGMIIFDRLHSGINDPARKNSYVPTGQMDGLKWQNDQWVFIRDAIPVLRLKDGEAPIKGVMQGTK